MNMHGLRADHKSLGGLGTSRWLEAFWEPSANLFTLPGGLDMLDISGDGDARLICADLGPIGNDSTRVRVYKGGDQITEHNMMDPPCGIVGFYTEDGESRSSVVAVGAGASVYVFKNMRPFFKYCLPHIDAHPKEREIWHKCGMDEELNVLILTDDLELLLKELGAAFLSPRTLKFLSMDSNLRLSFAEQYRRVPLVKANALTTIAVIRRDSWNDPASSCLILGTEAGEILVLDPRAFSIMDKHQLEWPPVAFASCGLWTGDGRIMIIGRDGKIAAIRRGSPVKLWETLSVPAVAISILTSGGAAVAIMDGTIVGFSKRGIKLWYIDIPGTILDLVSLPVPQSGLSLLAVSTAGYGVRIYDGKHHVDTMKIIEPVSALKYGRMGQEERTIAMVTVGGGLCMKILKRTADFNMNNSISNSVLNNMSKFFIPKKTRLFIDQTIRERSEAKKIHNTFQQGFLRLRLTIAKRSFKHLSENQVSGSKSITLEANVLGLGPCYMIRIMVTNISEGLCHTKLYIFCKSENTNVNPCVIDLPLLPTAISIPLTISANLKSQISGKIKIMLCNISNPKPLAITSVILPAAEEDFEVAEPVKLAYASYESLKKDEDIKPPVMIMHGLFGSKNNWNTLSKVIHQKTKHKVIAIDARNHGDSPHSINMSYKDMADDVIQLMHDLSFKKTILVGHSMGGSAMMYTALNFPNYVEKLIIVDVSPVRTSPNLWQMMMIFEAMRSVRLNGNPTLSKARKIVDEQLAKFIKSNTLRQFLMTNLVEADSGKYKWRINLPILEQTFSTQIAVFPIIRDKAYKGPTLFIGGANSDYIRIEDHDAIRMLFHQAEFHYINGADHWVHADKPAEFIDIVTNFINRPRLS